VSFVLDDRETEWIFTNLDIALPQFHKGYSYTFALYIDDSGFVEMGRLENVDGGNSSAPWETEAVRMVQPKVTRLLYQDMPSHLPTARSKHLRTPN